MLVVLGDLFVLVARRGELAALLAETQERTRVEPGCVSYAFAEVVGEPGRFVVAQEWRDEAALQAHYGSGAFAAYQERVGEFLARPSEVRIHYVRDTVRPEDGGPMDPRRAD